MRKMIFAVFAHPDDEAFGPAGTLIKEAEAGTEVHLVLLTAGENGTNNGYEDLGSVRLEEWRKSGALIGATSQDFWGYQDGKLSNKDMIEISRRLERFVKDKSYGADEVEMMSLEFGGLTGHIDHIVAARATAQTFTSLKETDDRLTKLRLFCLPRSLRPEVDYSWIYAEPGADESEIDEVVDATDLKPRIESVMNAHASQELDAAYFRTMLGDNLGMNWFKVIK